jgi:hypothetical protein
LVTVLAGSFSGVAMRLGAAIPPRQLQELYDRLNM